MQLHDAADSNEERVRIYHSLGYGPTDKLITRCLEFSLSVSSKYSNVITAGKSTVHVRVVVGTSLLFPLCAIISFTNIVKWLVSQECCVRLAYRQVCCHYLSAHAQGVKQLFLSVVSTKSPDLKIKVLL